MCSIINAISVQFCILLRRMRLTGTTRLNRNWSCCFLPAHHVNASGPFSVRLLIFTEKQIFDFDGNDIEHTKEVANGLYQHIPNVFSAHDPQELSYSLEKLYRENREAFLAFYEEEKGK